MGKWGFQQGSLATTSYPRPSTLLFPIPQAGTAESKEAPRGRVGSPGTPSPRGTPTAWSRRSVIRVHQSCPSTSGLGSSGFGMGSYPSGALSPPPPPGANHKKHKRHRNPLSPLVGPHAHRGVPLVTSVLLCGHPPPPPRPWRSMCLPCSTWGTGDACVAPTPHSLFPTPGSSPAFPTPHRGGHTRLTRGIRFGPPDATDHRESSGDAEDTRESRGPPADPPGPRPPPPDSPERARH